ncbi:uncharacterized protein [Nicotiana tomentosiformis]|uniref:uncharacterized protein n=1 Tax=Nicotiana tomentosiformis TaxID=4098 RepID=UPI00388C8378
MAKVRVEIDLTKPQPDSVWVGSENEEFPLKGYTQKIKYESIPKFCKHCRKLGHNMMNCRVLEKKRATKNIEADQNGKDTVLLQTEIGGRDTLGKKDVTGNNQRITTRDDKASSSKIPNSTGKQNNEGFTEVINRRNKKAKQIRCRQMWTRI